jgi:hypothetical protein
MRISRSPSNYRSAVESQEDFVFLRKGELTRGTYHIAVRTKFTMVAVGSCAMIGINCVLYRMAYH